LKEGVGFGVGFVRAILRREAKKGEGKRRKTQNLERERCTLQNI